MAILNSVTKPKREEKSLSQKPKSEVTGLGEPRSINCHNCHHKATMPDCHILYEAEDSVTWHLEGSQGQIKFDDIVGIYSRWGKSGTDFCLVGHNPLPWPQPPPVAAA
jgi:hypothetical protein